MDIKVEGARGNDLSAYFAKSGVTDKTQNPHTPLVAFVVQGDDLNVRIINKTIEALDLSPDTKIIAQWRGAYRTVLACAEPGRKWRKYRDSLLEQIKRLPKR